jgi:hypothetical protein
MPDEKPGDGVKEENAHKSPPVEATPPPPILYNPPTPPAQRVADHDVEGAIQAVENKVDQTQVWMVWLTAAIAFFALCSVGVGILQWNAMRGQLREMKSGGDDTHALAQAAVLQAQSAEALAGASNFQVITATEQVEAAKRAANDADQSVRQNTRSFQLDEQAHFKLTIGQHGWSSAKGAEMGLLANYGYSNIGKTEGRLIGVDKHVVLVANSKDLNLDTLTFEATRPTPVPKEQTIIIEPTSPSPAEQPLFITIFNAAEPSTKATAVDRESFSSLVMAASNIGTSSTIRTGPIFAMLNRPLLTKEHSPDALTSAREAPLSCCDTVSPCVPDNSKLRWKR